VGLTAAPRAIDQCSRAIAGVEAVYARSRVLSRTGRSPPGSDLPANVPNAPRPAHMNSSSQAAGPGPAAPPPQERAPTAGLPRRGLRSLEQVPMPAVQSRRFRTSAEPVHAAGDRKAPAESALSRPAPGWNATVSTGVRHAGTQALDRCCRQELANLWIVRCRPGLHYQGSAQAFRPGRTSDSQRLAGSRVPARPPPQRGAWAPRISAVAVPSTPVARQRRFRTGAEPRRAAACRRGRAGSERSRRAPG
jgi:hypothetical protein